MKQTIFFSLTLVALVTLGLLVLLINSEDSNLVNIKGAGFATEFDTVTLKYFDHETQSYLAIRSHSLAENDEFEFTFPFQNSNLYELNFDEREMIPVSVENASTIQFRRINGKTTVKGSESTKKALNFRSLNDQLQSKYFGQLKIDFDKAMAENNQEKIKQLEEKSKLMIDKFLVEFRDLITDLGTTPAAFYAIQFSDFNKELEFLEQRIIAFQTEAPDSPLTKALKKQVYQAKVTSIGNRPPPFETKNDKGEPISLLAYQGNIVLVDFWASWCRACRIENPKFVQLYEKYHTQDFEIISISQDDSISRWRTAIEKDGIGNWTQIIDQDKTISTLYSISSLPQNILLDKDGIIIAKNISADDLAQLLVTL